MNRMHEAVVAGLAGESVGFVALHRFPGYFVGTGGNVISVKGRKPVVMKPIRLGNYDGFGLTDITGKPRKVYRHRLVAEAYHGPCPDGMECRHLDGNKANAAFDNVAWGTPVENNADKKQHGTHLEGDRHPSAKLTSAAVLQMRAIRHTTGTPYKVIARQFGVTAMTAYRAINGQSWECAE